MQVAICDDEKAMHQIVEKNIKRLLPDADIRGFWSGDDLIASGCKPDLLFLDIQMPGRDGMETARILRKNNPDMILIFVTAIEEYVFQAFDVGAFHYLIKPIDEKKFTEVVKLAKEKLSSTKSGSMEHACSTERASILVSAGGIHTKVYFDEIVYAEVFNRKIVIHTLKDEIEYYGKMSDLARMAGDQFFRPHRAYLINMRYVVRYDASNIYLEKGQVLMAKQNYKNFVESYMKYSMRESH